MIAIDPGNKVSAWAMYTPTVPDELGGPVDCGIDENAALIDRIHKHLVAGTPVIVEKIECYGMAVGADVFETCYMVGRIQEAVRASQIEFAESDRSTVFLMPRRVVKLHLCNSVRAKDGNIRQALIDRFGGDTAIGKKANPGPLYKVKSHCWSALALAVTFSEMNAASA